VGALVSFAIPELVVGGQRPVELRSARIIEVLPGIEAVSVMAAHYRATGGYVAVTDDDPSSSALPVPKLYPISAVRLVPGQTTDRYLPATVPPQGGDPLRSKDEPAILLSHPIIGLGVAISRALLTYTALAAAPRRLPVRLRLALCPGWPPGGCDRVLTA
jgi:hypothetical protein